MLLTLLWKSAVYPGYTTRLHFRKKLQSSRLVIVLNLRMVHHPKWDTNHRKILNITRVRQTYEMGFKVYRWTTQLKTYRNSRPEVFCEKGVLRNSLFYQAAGLKPATLLKKKLWHRCFSVNFAKFLRTPFLTVHLWWLLLDLQKTSNFELVKNFD